MCGIFSTVGYQPTSGQIDDALHVLRHRGPDEAGVHIASKDPVVLAHTRLSIMGVESGKQPLRDRHGNWVACNGELYGYPELRANLEARGHTFHTRSDSELLLPLYREYGLDFFEHLRGEFAFVLYDSVRRRVIAARDRFGVKPLYFTASGGKWTFASEVKAFFASGILRPELDPCAVRDLVCAVAPHTVFRGVEAISPGEFIAIDLNTMRSHRERYWTMNFASDTQVVDPAGAVRDTVEDAVRTRLQSDVPLGVYLSGGLDSAIVGAVAAKYSDQPVKAFTISFPGKDPRFDELGPARAMAAHAGLEPYVVECTPEVIYRNLESSIWVSELPCFNLHGVAKFALSKLASQHVRVVLTGEGADELFLGYDFFHSGKGCLWAGGKLPSRKHELEMARALNFVPRVQGKLTSPIGEFLHTRLFNEKAKEELRERPLLARLAAFPAPDESYTRRMQHTSIHCLLHPYLLSVLGDRQEMAHSIEGRPPFLDHALFDLVRNIPDDAKYRNGEEKAVLREAFKDLLCPAILERRKWPLLAPANPVRRGETLEMDRLFSRYLSRTALDDAGIFSAGTVSNLARLARIPNRRIQFIANSIMSLVLSVQVLHDRFVRNFEESMHELNPATTVPPLKPFSATAA